MYLIFLLSLPSLEKVDAIKPTWNLGKKLLISLV